MILFHCYRYPGSGCGFTASWCLSCRFWKQVYCLLCNWFYLLRWRFGCRRKQCVGGKREPNKKACLGFDSIFEDTVERNFYDNRFRSAASSSAISRLFCGVRSLAIMASPSAAKWSRSISFWTRRRALIIAEIWWTMSRQFRSASIIFCSPRTCPSMRLKRGCCRSCLTSMPPCADWFDFFSFFLISLYSLSY